MSVETPTLPSSSRAPAVRRIKSEIRPCRMVLSLITIVCMKFRYLAFHRISRQKSPSQTESCCRAVPSERGTPLTARTRIADQASAAGLSHPPLLIGTTRTRDPRSRSHLSEPSELSVFSRLSKSTQSASSTQPVCQARRAAECADGRPRAAHRISVTSEGCRSENFFARSSGSQRRGHSQCFSMSRFGNDEKPYKENGN